MDQIQDSQTNLNNLVLLATNLLNNREITEKKLDNLELSNKIIDHLFAICERIKEIENNKVAISNREGILTALNKQKEELKKLIKAISNLILIV